ncbi:MAG: acyl-CoA dehydrogenase family protein [Bacteroidia bacterium]
MTEKQSNTDLAQFRQETRDWLSANCPESMRQPVKSFIELYQGGRNPQFDSEDQKVWFERMLAKGWTVPQWDKKYGGGGLSRMEQKVLSEEMTALGCRLPLFSFGISMLGPALLKFASEEQKKRFLPEIARGEVRWCQGYSEPGAGSDLAGLKTKAEDRGDHYLVSGQKVWTSYADEADWIFCLVRTDFEVPKHSGISFLLIDMASEGVSTRPIKLISGKSPFCETFFDNAKVPQTNLIGQEGKGWSIAKFLLTHERQMIGGFGDTNKPKALSQIAKEQMQFQDRLPDAMLRTEIATFEMDEAIFDLTIERAIDEAKAGNASGALSSFFKYYGTELNKRRFETMLSLHGFAGLSWEDDLAKRFCRTKGNSIEGGTSEIQLNIISKRILGLP